MFHRMRFWKCIATLLLLWGLTGNALPAQRPDPQQLRAATERALGYFTSHRQQIDPDAFLIGQFLQRKFGLPPIFEVAVYVEGLKANPQWSAEFQPFMRLAEPTRFQRRWLQPTGLINDITIAAVWNDHLHPKKELWRRIETMDFDEPYNITHAFLAEYLAAEYFHHRPSPTLHDHLLQAMDSIIALSEATMCDFQIEAIALRQFRDATYEPPSLQMQKLLDQQNPDGTWDWCAATNPHPSQHTTILALWALLEYGIADYPARQTPFLFLK